MRVPRRNDVRNEVQGRGHFLSALINKQSAEKVARESRETGERQAASSSSSRKRQPKATATATVAAIGYMMKAGFVCVAWCVAVGW